MSDAARAGTLRLLLVAPEYPPQTGGMETHAGETARRLAARGHRVTVLTAAHREGPRGGEAVPVEPRLDRRFGRALRLIAERARTLRSDAILLMNAGYAPIALGDPRSLPPVLARTVGNDAYGAWHGPRLPLRFLFWRLPHARPESAGARLRRLDQDRRVRTVLAGLSRCDAVLCNSRYTRSRLQELGVPPARLGLLVGGVDPERYRPAPSRSAGTIDRPVLGTAGRLKPIKGFEVALEATARLRQAGRDARLLLAGTGPEEKSLRDRAARLGLDGAVEFLGDLDAGAMPEFYHRLDVYLQPSVEIRHEATGLPQAESMGRALLEAQASGVPVVASLSGGIPDVVENGCTGLLVPPGDAGALGAAIARLCDETGLRQRLVAEARRSVVDRFSWEAVVRETERALVAALRRRGAGTEADGVDLPA
ncbi:MAG TPA: glycosyltransferase family 4 protein [Candidatus Polarisedimenticolia bacterium]|nr:glycosyltransferase family 4 protein [Candidatus Polarisedimenticolia bacterium]